MKGKSGSSHSSIRDAVDVEVEDCKGMRVLERGRRRRERERERKEWMRCVGEEGRQAAVNTRKGEKRSNSHRLTGPSPYCTKAQ